MLSRLEKKYADGTLHGVFILGRYYSPDELLEEAKKGTPVGEQMLIGQKKLIDELKRLGGIP
jgi:hypothetical protein